ncbi:MAG: sulfatase-like hydrolase/transferase, partial [Planctomycetales bacterium]|nr:sulfatase-like hydrolase/transferase [Planctomycetales bacterium]
MGVRLVVLAAAALALCGEAHGSESRPPNIVYFLIDDMGFADCGFNGSSDVATPQIDALAARGTVFENFYVQPLCSATRATFLTGRYPIRHGIYGALKVGSKSGLPLQERLLPQDLKAAGYSTAICGKWHVGEFEEAYRPLQRGFDRQYGLWYGQIDYFTHERGGRVDWYRNDERIDEEGYSTHLIANEAVEIIRSHEREKPLFLYVPFNAVHGPFQVPAGYEQPYRNLKPRRATFAGMLAAVDEAIGSVVQALREAGMEGETLVIFS